MTKFIAALFLGLFLIVNAGAEDKIPEINQIKYQQATDKYYNLRQYLRFKISNDKILRSMNANLCSASLHIQNISANDIDCIMYFGVEFVERITRGMDILRFNLNVFDPNSFSPIISKFPVISWQDPKNEIESESKISIEMVELKVKMFNIIKKYIEEYSNL